MVVGSLDNSFGFDWGMDVENGFEGGGKLICQVGCIGCWVCVERGSEDVTFEIVNINGFVKIVWLFVKLEGVLCAVKFKCERF